MPWASKKQAAWGHSPNGLRALGGQKKVQEWDRATTPGTLPERSLRNVAKKPKAK